MSSEPQPAALMPFSAPIDRMARAEPSNVQEIAASQIQLLTVYHNVVLDQSQRSFLWATVAAAVGLAFFVAAVAFTILQMPANSAVISVISGALVEVISGVNFYLYNRASEQLSSFQLRLDRTQRYLLANSLCEWLEGEYKQQARLELIRKISDFNEPEINATNPNPNPNPKPNPGASHDPVQPPPA